MSKTISGIRGYLLTQLSTLLPTGSNKLADVQQGRVMNFAGYPACRFYSIGMTEVLKDQKNQYRNYKLVIELIYKLTAENRATAEATMEDAMEAVMNAIDTDYTLGGYADNAILSVGTAMEGEYPWGPSLVMKLTLNAYTVQFFS